MTHYRWMFLLVLVAGCNSAAPPAGQIAWHSDIERSQIFNTGYVSNLKAPNSDVVLMFDPGLTVVPGDGTGPIQPSAESPARQTMLIHIYFRPESTMHAGKTVVSATLDWYILDGDDYKTGSWIHYGGAGFVLLYAHDGWAEVEIVDAALSPKGHQGNMTDPVGTSHIHGQARVIENDAYVTQAMNGARDVSDTPTTKP